MRKPELSALSFAYKASDQTDNNVKLVECIQLNVEVGVAGNVLDNVDRRKSGDGRLPVTPWIQGGTQDS